MLLQNLQKLSSADLSAYVAQWVMTFNVNDPGNAVVEHALRQKLLNTPISLIVINNTRPQGFGANHNAAFAHNKQPYFCIANPDVIVNAQCMRALSTTLSSDPKVGCAYPRQVDALGQPLDFERSLVTPWQLVRRYAFKDRRLPTKAQWVSGSVMAFPTQIYRELQGFDERYYMYCEDVDICLRLQMRGYALTRSDYSVMHDAQRNTLRRSQHFFWHLHSLCKLWLSKTFWQYLRWRSHYLPHSS
jgi:N-acetylglucosaminyl-diphospho-decaprenol L-rhamnosyltransferase